MHRNGHDDITHSMVKVVMTSPDANHFEPGFLEGSWPPSRRRFPEVSYPRVGCVQGDRDLNRDRFAEFFGHLDVSCNRLLDMRQRLFPGRPLADTSRKGWYRYGIPSILILLHKNGITETSLRQSNPSSGEVVLETI